jgi:hypothetical protein
MDPLTAISLASNIVQFVDLGCKILSGAYEVYRSSEGSTAEDLDLTKVVDDLDTVTTKLAASIEQKEKALAQHQQFREDEFDERLLAYECLGVGREIKLLLKNVASDCKKGKLSSLRQGILCVWYRDEIEVLKNRLARFREQLVFRMLVSLR